MAKIICEIASSHNQDLDLAKALIDSASKNGADIVKFQDWRASNVPDTDSDKKRYERYEFPEEWYKILIPYCEEKGTEFLTSCFNVDRVEFLASLGLKKIKIASVSAFNHDLIIKAGAHFEELIVSTGMHNQKEVEELVDLLATNAQKFTIMACTAEYPCPPENANLARIETLKELTKGMEYANVGFSSHALDMNIPGIALAQGIKYLEVHFSLARELPQTPHRMYKNGPLVTTHSVSLIPSELRHLVEWKYKIVMVKGNGEFIPSEVEQAIKNRYLKRYGK